MHLPVSIFAESSSYAFSANTQFTHELVLEIATYSMYLLELISIAIIVFTTFVAFFKLFKKEPYARVYLLHGQSIALTFKLGAEILRTVTAASLYDIIEVFLLILIKACMVALVEKELRSSKAEIEDEQQMDQAVLTSQYPVFGVLRPKTSQLRTENAVLKTRVDYLEKAIDDLKAGLKVPLDDPSLSSSNRIEDDVILQNENSMLQDRLNFLQNELENLKQNAAAPDPAKTESSSADID
jgi:uncharacterized membrane protein